MVAEAFQDKRRFPRVGRNWFVHYKRQESVASEWNVGRVNDLSASGVCFSTNESLEVKAGLKMKFNLPIPLLQLVRGTVVWRRKGRTQQYEYGITFEGINPQDAGEIDQLVRNLLKKRY